MKGPLYCCDIVVDYLDGLIRIYKPSVHTNCYSSVAEDPKCVPLPQHHCLLIILPILAVPQLQVVEVSDFFTWALLEKNHLWVRVAHKF